MDRIQNFIDLEKKRIALQKELEPLQKKMSDLVYQISAFNSNMPYGVSKVITEKLWENLSDYDKEKIQNYNKEVDNMFQTSAYHMIQKPKFNPRVDEWRLVTFEEDEEKIRFQVSCIKNEGSISGLMTFLDTYWTVWFDKKELEGI